MTVVLELEPELERALQAQAEVCGVSTLKLPARDLGDMGALHRRDIYDDAR